MARRRCGTHSDLSYSEVQYCAHFLFLFKTTSILGMIFGFLVIDQPEKYVSHDGNNLSQIVDQEVAEEKSALRDNQTASEVEEDIG